MGHTLAVSFAPIADVTMDMSCGRMHYRWIRGKVNEDDSWEKGRGKPIPMHAQVKQAQFAPIKIEGQGKASLKNAGGN